MAPPLFPAGRQWHAGLAAVLWLGLAILPVGAAAQGVNPPAGNDNAVHAWTLDEVVSAAVSQHPLVEADQARVDAARSVRSTVEAIANPVASVLVENASFPWQDPIPGLSRELSGAVSWPVETLLQRGPRLRLADEDIRAAEATSAATRRLVVDAAVRAFFRVALAQALADEAVENRTRLEQLAEYNRARVAEGVTAEGELLRVEVELDQAATAIVVAEVELTRSRAELRPYLAGDPAAVFPDDIRVRVSTDTSAAATLPPLATVVDRARAARPELVAGRARVAAAEAGIDVERRLPLSALGVTFGGKGFEGRTSMIAGLSISVPIFNVNRSGVARATYERVAAEAEVRWIERTITAEVEGAHRAATQLTAQLTTLEQSFIARAEEVNRLTVGAYQEGGASLLQVLDATRMLVEARMTFFRTLAIQRLSLLELALATGAAPMDALGLYHTWSTPPAMGGPTGGQ